MNHQFDELTKGIAQSVTRRGALKKFGVGLAGMALACFGLTSKARAATYSGYCEARPSPYRGTILRGNKWALTGSCIGMDVTTGLCITTTSEGCQPALVGPGKTTPCGSYWSTKHPCSFTW